MIQLRSDRDAYFAGLDQWARMYVDGYWTLERFEAHADTMMHWLLRQEAT
jgi:hypothetical protein